MMGKWEITTVLIICQSAARRRNAVKRAESIRQHREECRQAGKRVDRGAHSRELRGGRPIELFQRADSGQAPEGIISKDQVDMNSAYFEKYLFERTGRKFNVELGPWQTIFEITHGTSEQYRRGNVMVAGDASHVHSPVGGQGMNLGIQDSNNILWKLAWAKRIVDSALSDEERVAAAASADIILGSYNTERHELGKSLVKSVEQATTILSTRSPFLKFVRNTLIRVGVPRNGTLNNFRRAGQLELQYPPQTSAVIIENTTASKKTCICSPGQRLPNICLNDGSRMHSHIDRIHHTWVYLNKPSALAQVSHQKVVNLSASDKQTSIPLISKEACLGEQVILVRPDLFVAGVGRNREELMSGLQMTGLDEKAVAMM